MTYSYKLTFWRGGLRSFVGRRFLLVLLNVVFWLVTPFVGSPTYEFGQRQVSGCQVNRYGPDVPINRDAICPKCFDNVHIYELPFCPMSPLARLSRHVVTGSESVYIYKSLQP